ncbi:MAG: flagellar biosynthesis protein FlhB [Bordetella sp.]|uniref:flagellar biosynthesis protein FlhB n=1 Tax=Bordetella sp. TaxID=28081 RepID=UPI003F7BD7AA
MADDSDLEKTEAPSGKRLQQARDEGQIMRSRELGTFLLLATGLAGLWLSGGDLYRDLTSILRHSLGFDPLIAHDPAVMIAGAAGNIYQILLLMLPIFGALVVAAILGATALGGLVLTTKPLEFDFKHFNIASGFGRMFSLQTVVELVKASFKAILIGGVGAWVLWLHLNNILVLVNASPASAITRSMSLVALCIVLVVASLILIVAMDVPWQIWSYIKKLRMTKDEVKQENKDAEGDPQIKGRIRQQQRAVARRRMMAAVPKANVVVTNPTRYAVALSYSEGQEGAPRVVAKGTDQLAARIRELAAEHRIPILEAPPLARALYQHVDLGREIPIALYSAVAEVLAWVFQLRSWRVGMGLEPKPPVSLAVPTELDPQNTAQASAAAPEGV